jgi:hypothetical protein
MGNPTAPIETFKNQGSGMVKTSLLNTTGPFRSDWDFRNRTILDIFTGLIIKQFNDTCILLLFQFPGIEYCVSGAFDNDLLKSNHVDCDRV